MQNIKDKISPVQTTNMHPEKQGTDSLNIHFLSGNLSPAGQYIFQQTISPVKKTRR